MYLCIKFNEVSRGPADQTVYKRRARDPTSQIICLTSGLGIRPFTDKGNKSAKT